MSSCRACGQPVEESAFFCSGCGRATSEPVATPAPGSRRRKWTSFLGWLGIAGAAAAAALIIQAGKAARPPEPLASVPARAAAGATTPADGLPTEFESPRVSPRPTGAIAPSYTSESALDRRPLTFKGYDCTDDCSGHEAGYNWAEAHDIDDPDDCGGNSQSFIEGCRAYAEEQQDGDPTDEERPANDE